MVEHHLHGHTQRLQTNVHALHTLPGEECIELGVLRKQSHVHPFHVEVDALRHRLVCDGEEGVPHENVGGLKGRLGVAKPFHHRVRLSGEVAATAYTRGIGFDNTVDFDYFLSLW